MAFSSAERDDSILREDSSCLRALAEEATQNAEKAIASIKLTMKILRLVNFIFLSVVDSNLRILLVTA
jgi:hypothetical protein